MSTQENAVVRFRLAPPIWTRARPACPAGSPPSLPPAAPAPPHPAWAAAHPLCRPAPGGRVTPPPPGTHLTHPPHAPTSRTVRARGETPSMRCPGAPTRASPRRPPRARGPGGRPARGVPMKSGGGFAGVGRKPLGGRGPGAEGGRGSERRLASGQEPGRRPRGATRPRRLQGVSSHTAREWLAKTGVWQREGTQV